MRDHNDPVSECKVPHSCFYVCVFPPSRRGGSCDSFYRRPALGALTASEGPSERPNVNLMTWRWANDKYARWRWQPFFFFPSIWFFFPLRVPCPSPGLVFWEPWWCYIYYTIVCCWQSLLWISTIVKAPFKSTSFLHYAKKFLCLLSKMTFALRQSQRTF